MKCVVYKTLTIKDIADLLLLSKNDNLHDLNSLNLQIRKDRIRLKRGQANDNFTSLTAIQDIFDLLKLCVTNLSDSIFTLLIDDMELSDDRVIPFAVWTGSRKFCIKISTSTLYNLQMFSAKGIRQMHDFQLINLDSLNLEKERIKLFEKHIESIANLRLREKGLNYNIKELLGVKVSNDYPFTGFSRFVRLSGGSIRSFLRYCKESVEYTFKDYHGKLPSTLKGELPRKDQEIVAERIAYDEYHSLRDSNKLGFMIVALIDSFGEYSSRRYNNTASKQKTLRFSIKDPENLSTESNLVLSECVKHGALLVPYERQRQLNPNLKKLTSFILNRTLCPKYKILPITHQQIEFSSKQIELMVHDREAFLKEMKYDKV